jgi:arylsulfatase A-like enzyme
LAILGVAAFITLVSGCAERGQPDVRGLQLATDLLAPTVRLGSVAPGASTDWAREDDTIVPIAGWGGVEELSGEGVRYRWAIDRTAELLVHVAGGVALRLEFQAWPLTWNGAPEQRVEVEVNGVVVDEVELKRGFRSYDVDLPAGLTGPGRNVIRLRFAYAERPSSVRPSSDDDRILAAAFATIRVVPRRAVEPSRRGASPRADGVLELEPGWAAWSRVTVPERAVLELDVPTDSRHAVGVWIRDSSRRYTALGDIRPGTRKRYELAAWAGEAVEIAVVNRSPGNPATVGDWKVFAESAVASDLPNVIVMVVDTLRADHVGVYGGGDLTPNLDRLATEGVWFSEARSHAPITGPSHSSLFTSVLPMSHGVHNNSQLLQTEADTLAEAMRTTGRHTAAFVSLGVLQSGFGFRQGFDHYGDDFPRDWMKDASEVKQEVIDWAEERPEGPFFAFVHFSDPHEPYASPDTDLPWVQVSLDGAPIGRVRSDGRASTLPMTLEPGRHVLRLAGRMGEGSWAFRVPQLEVEGATLEVTPDRGWKEKTSGPWSLESELPASISVVYDGDSPVDVALKLRITEVLSVPKVRHRYREEVRYVDREIGRLLDELEPSGLLEDTIVVVTSDHGEGLGDHGLVGHIHQLYDSLTRVPLIFWGPGRIPPGIRVDEPVSLIDVFPTLSELADVPLPSGAQGRSLVAVVRAADGVASTPASISETYRPEAKHDRRAVVLDGFKYIRTYGDNGRVTEELYDLTADPDESRDLSGADPDRLASMRDDLDARIAQESTGRPVQVELTEEEKAQLRALGYLHD